MGYLNKLKSIKEKKQSLLQEEKQAIEKRKFEIARIAEKCGILESEDDLIAAAFLIVKNPEMIDKEIIARLKKDGGRFCKSPKRAERTEHSKKNSSAN